MITLDGVCKTHVLNGVRKTVARDLDFSFPPGECIGLLGRNGAGKSTLLQLIAGLIPPDAGRVMRRGTVSWPVGFQGSFHPDLTGAENARFVARLYGVDTGAMVGFVEGFAELGSHLHLPVRSYSAGMKARLAFAVSMAVPFDTYLIDEVTSVGDAAFRARSEAVLRDRLRNAGAIIVSHALPMLRHICGPGLVLENGRLFFYVRIERAIEHHQYLMQNRLPPWMQ